LKFKKRRITEELAKLITGLLEKEPKKRLNIHDIILSEWFAIPYFMVYRNRDEKLIAFDEEVTKEVEKHKFETEEKKKVVPEPKKSKSSTKGSYSPPRKDGKGSPSLRGTGSPSTRGTIHKRTSKTLLAIVKPTPKLSK